MLILIIIIIISCGVMYVQPECHLTEIDLSEEYPACCPQVVCDTVETTTKKPKCGCKKNKKDN